MWAQRTADAFDQFFRVFHEGAPVPIQCYQAAIEQPDGGLRGWFQPERGFERGNSTCVAQ